MRRFAILMLIQNITMIPSANAEIMRVRINSIDVNKQTVLVTPLNSSAGEMEIKMRSDTEILGADSLQDLDQGQEISVDARISDHSGEWEIFTLDAREKTETEKEVTER